MLVCAPTGAGKTNIAMITVLHEVSQHMDSCGSIRKDEFKIVYVAPMKALAAEVTRTFGSRLEALGLQVMPSLSCWRPSVSACGKLTCSPVSHPSAPPLRVMPLSVMQHACHCS
jgi:CRISPR/Cas system-associated endonuclease/helicase Cas3